MHLTRHFTTLTHNPFATHSAPVLKHVSLSLSLSLSLSDTHSHTHTHTHTHTHYHTRTIQQHTHTHTHTNTRAHSNILMAISWTTPKPDPWSQHVTKREPITGRRSGTPW